MTDALHLTSSSPSASLPLPLPPSSSSSPPSCQGEELVKQRERDQSDELSLLVLIVTLFRKSLAACKSERRRFCVMDIGWPTNVRHVAHVTFDKFNGFLGLPVEFEPDVPRRPPSASTTVFGVSTESMQLSFDSRGNSVPTILLLMQRHLYARGGLQAEGIFRINAENSQEEVVRDQLNWGVLAEGIDVHCLAGLIKAWFRELPTGVLDSLEPEQVIQCQTEDQCTELVRHLPPTEAALLDWAINLMADVVEQEHVNKMNARNIAMVFAPNMTQLADPLSALMYAVQVMNFLKTLILRTLREREDSVVEPTPASRLEPIDENGRQCPSQPRVGKSEKDKDSTESMFTAKGPVTESSRRSDHDNFMADGEVRVSLIVPLVHQSCENPTQVDSFSGKDTTEIEDVKVGDHTSVGKSEVRQSSNSNRRKVPGKLNRQQSVARVTQPDLGNHQLERVEAWR